ncbi:hypothetical protein HOL34_03765 [bacterium]|nr:hypothetical protein [bacterium]MBT3903916.1 hypothetical protein [bacterium]MBT4577696.1 hypothetical protein [bacterium]MBT5345527.1 hypothetical protein [bacterium]MBT6529196.1 hypothetical protein [bacterium]
MIQKEHSHSDCEHGHGSVWSELLLHTPYAIMSVAFGFVVLSFSSFFFLTDNTAGMQQSCDIIFHSFHFMHIVFAVSGTFVMFLRFSKNILLGLILSVIAPTLFCLLSDVMFPYLAGYIMGIPMDLHICLVSEMHNIIPFTAIGLLHGAALSYRSASHQSSISVSSHAVHIFISSMASMFYLVGHGCMDWFPKMGMIFLLMIIAVVVPCTLSDVVVPMYFSRVGKGKENA